MSAEHRAQDLFSFGIFKSKEKKDRRDFSLPDTGTSPCPCAPDRIISGLFSGVAFTLQDGRNWSTHTDKVEHFSFPRAAQCLATVPRVRVCMCVCVHTRASVCVLPGKLLGL